MSLKHGLLGLLNYGPMSGYNLSKAFDASLSLFWHAKSQQIYRELNAMQGNGWLTSELVIQRDKPNKRIYYITDAGKHEFADWLAQPHQDISDAMCAKNAFLMRVFFAGETSDADALEMIRAYREKCKDSLAEIQQAMLLGEGYSADVSNERKTIFWKLTALHGEKYYRAGIEWADEVIEVLDGKDYSKNAEFPVP